MKSFTIIRGTAFVLFTLIVLSSCAQKTIQQAGYYRMQVGSIQVTALSDGTVPVSAMQLFDEAHEPEKVSHLLQSNYLADPVEVSINAYLIHLQEKLILVDAGSGNLFGPIHGGKLKNSLSAAGYRPEQITDILITHVHLDHSGGLVLNDSILFPNATIHINKKEISYWLNHIQPQTNEAKGITSGRSSFMVLKRYLDKNMVKPFEKDSMLYPGVSAKEYSGHTAGHSVYILESQGQRLVFWGDLIHIADIQLTAPELYNGFDSDKQKAVAQRIKAYDEAASEGYLIAADHISFPGIGRVRRTAGGFQWTPLPYSLMGRTQ